MAEYWLGIACLLWSVSAATGASFVPVTGGTTLFPGEIASGLSLDKRTSAQGENKLVRIEGEPFTQAVELRSGALPKDNFDLQMVEKIPTAIHTGDVLWITLWARATQTSGVTHQAFAQFTVAQLAFPYSAMANFDFAVGSDWRQLAWNFVVRRDYGPGEAEICLRGGYAPQTMQFAGIQVLDYGKSVKPADFPHHKVAYLGMEANAPWRKAAAERIEKYRKSDLTVVVKDSFGRSLSGATVKIEEQHANFGFGSCVDARLITGTDGRLLYGPKGDHERYLETIRKSYNKVVLESDLKWGYRGDAMWRSWTVDAPERHKNTLDALHWLEDQGIQIRGHNLVWPSWMYSPEDLLPLKNNPTAMEARIEDHIRDIVGATKGQLSEWDVVNEPYANHDLLDVVPPGSMANWFKLVHQLDPKPVLYLNDYAGFLQCGEDTLHKQSNEKTLRTLKEQGAPIGGYGIQAHFDEELAGPEQVVNELDRWAALGLDLQITEFDVDIADEQVQAQYTHDFLTAVFSHPGVNAFVMWGFWERADGKPGAALYRKDWSVKPNGQAWNNLVLKEWRTNLTLPTNAAGTVAARCFQGQYQITVTYLGKMTTFPLNLGSTGAVVPVTLR